MFLPYLILPGHRHASRVKLEVEIFIDPIKAHSFNRRELIDVQDVCAVNCSRLVERITSQDCFQVKNQHSQQEEKVVAPIGYHYAFMPFGNVLSKTEMHKLRSMYDGVVTLCEQSQ